MVLKCVSYAKVSWSSRLLLVRLYLFLLCLRGFRSGSVVCPGPAFVCVDFGLIYVMSYFLDCLHFFCDVFMFVGSGFISEVYWLIFSLFWWIHFLNLYPMVL